MIDDIKSCRIGDKGKATTPLAPCGVVEIQGESFSARANGPAIDEGTAVVVTDGDVGGLVVRPYRNEAQVELIERFGEPAYNSFGDRAKAVAAREAEERLEALAAWVRIAKVRQVQIGAAFGALAVCLLNVPMIAAEFSLPMRVACGLVVFIVASAWAIGVFRAIEWAVHQFDEEFTRLVTISTCLALSGSAFGLWSIESLGMQIGLALTFVSAVAGAAVIPLVSTLFISGE